MDPNAMLPPAASTATHKAPTPGAFGNARKYDPLRDSPVSLKEISQAADALLALRFGQGTNRAERRGTEKAMRRAVGNRKTWGIILDVASTKLRVNGKLREAAAKVARAKGHAGITPRITRR